MYEKFHINHFNWNLVSQSMMFYIKVFAPDCLQSGGLHFKKRVFHVHWNFKVVVRPSWEKTVLGKAAASEAYSMGSGIDGL